MTTTLRLGDKVIRVALWAYAAPLLLGTLAACSSGGDTVPPPPPPQRFTLTVAATGNGRITSADGAIDCGTRCTADFASGTTVTLTAAPTSGHSLQSWGGACASSTGTSCSVSVTQATSVTATFAQNPPPPVALAVVIAGNGAVASNPSGISCPSSCTANFATGTSVTLTATPASGAVFSSWSGACAGTTLSCTLTLSQAATATATFEPAPVAEGWADVATIPGAIATDVRVALDASSNATAIWRGPTSSTNAIQSVFASRSIAGAAWSTPVEIDGSATENAADPQLAVDPGTGRIAALWLADGGLRGAAFAPETGWGAAQLIDRIATFQGAVVRDYRVGVDGVGEAVAVWAKNNEVNTFGIWSSRYVLGSGWNAPVRVDSNEGFGFQDVSPVITVLGTGAAHAVWASRGPNRLGYWANTFSPSTGWGMASELIKMEGRRQLGPMAVKADGQGGAALAWNEFDLNDSSQRLSGMFAKRLVGGGWQSANTPVAPPIVITGQAPSSPLLAVAPAGSAMLGWTLEDRALRASVSASGSAWGAVSLVKPASSDIEINEAATAIDDSGRGFAAWIQWRPNVTDPQLWISRYGAGAGWGTPSLHQTNTQPSGKVNLEMNGRGNAIIVWLQQNQIRSRYFSSGR